MQRLIVLLFLSCCCLPSAAQISAAEVNEELGCTFSFPWVNNYRFIDYEKGERAKKTGFFGLGIGLFYQKNDQKVSFNFSYTEDLSSPAGLIDYSKKTNETAISSTFGEITWHKKIIPEIFLIIGLNLTNYRYYYLHIEPNPYSFRKIDKTLGGTTGLEYRFNKFLSAATIYRPVLSSFETDGIYRHTISLDIRIDIIMGRMKRNYFP